MIDDNTAKEITEIIDNYLNDNNTLEEHKEININRNNIGENEIKPLIIKFFKEKITLDEFKTKNDSLNKKNSLWGFNGMAGAMFFNKLNNSEDDKERLEKELRRYLLEPDDINGAKLKIDKFSDYVKKVRNNVENKRKAPAPGSSMFFLSYFWHIQAPDKYPIYYPQSRKALNKLGLFDESGRDDYGDLYIEFLNNICDFSKVLENKKSKKFTLDEISNILYWYVNTTRDKDFWICLKDSCDNFEIKISRNEDNIIDIGTYTQIIIHFLQHLKYDNILFGGSDIIQLFQENIEYIFSDKDKGEYIYNGHPDIIWKNQVRSTLNYLKTKGYIETETSTENLEKYNKDIDDKRKVRKRRRTDLFLNEYEIFDDWELYKMEPEEINYWIFQSNSNIYNLQKAIKELEIDTFTVNQHSDMIKKGDMVAFWISGGNEAGMVGYGKTLSNPTIIPPYKKGLVYLNNGDYQNDKLRVWVSYQALPSKILKNDFMEILKSYKLIPEEISLIKQPQGTNFSIDKNVWNVIMTEIIINYWSGAPQPLQNEEELEEITDQTIFGKMMLNGYYALGWEKLQHPLDEVDIETINNPSLKKFVLMEQGDIIIAKKGVDFKKRHEEQRHRIYGVGVVNSDYNFDKSFDQTGKHNFHFRKLKWFINFSINPVYEGEHFLDLKEHLTKDHNLGTQTLIKKNYNLYNGVKNAIIEKLRDIKKDDKEINKIQKQFEDLEQEARLIKDEISNKNISQSIDIKKDSENLLFCRTGWMKYYKGIIKDDKIVRGGKYVDEYKYGGEIYNFQPINGKCYGFVQANFSTIKIDRLGGTNDKDFLDNVNVIWVATSEDGGQKIYGWYKNAIVYRKPQYPEAKLNRTYQDEVLKYNILADEKNCVLIPEKERNFDGPLANQKGYGFGMSNVWYAEEEAAVEYRIKVLDFINGYEIETIQEKVIFDISKIKENYMTYLLKNLNQIEETTNTKPLVREILKLLEKRKQVILIGPPGTGKTYFAQLVGKKLSEGDLNHINLIQFHPEYCYENFIECLQIKSGSEMELELKIQTLRRICQDALNDKLKVLYENYLKAQDNNLEAEKQTEFINWYEKKKEADPNFLSDKIPKYVLIIDEINRGDLSRIFGEAIMALEYRDLPIETMYSDKNHPLVIPDNLYMIGTMNSVDRSIAILDYALRRRFLFYEVKPNRAILEEWLEDNKSVAKDEILQVFDRLNDKKDGWIIDTWKDSPQLATNFQIGHTYFFHKTKEQFQVEWEYSIVPLLLEYMYFSSDLINSFKEKFDLKDPFITPQYL